MILWPHVLPQQLLVEGYGEQLSNQLIRTEMDAGPAKVRRRFTAAPRPVNGSIIVTPAQLVFFRNWYYNVLLGGSLRFGWTDPFTGDELTNLVTNSGFDSATTGWTGTHCTISSVSGGVYGNCLALTIDDDPAHENWQEAQQYAALTVGNTYSLATYHKTGTLAAGKLVLLYYDSVGGLSVQTTTESDWTLLQTDFVATAASQGISLLIYNEDHGTMLFDEVSLVDITAGIMEMRFIEPPTLSPIDPTAIRINMALEILP